MRKVWSGVVVAVLAVLLLTPIHPARAEDGDDDGHNPIVYVGVVLTNIVYFPAKLVYSVLGGITGTLAYAVTIGDGDTAQAIWDDSCRGTYFVTPRMLEGKDDIRFKGP
ncbi:MAG TPA: hypothetical protein VL403_05085 [Candidatus Kryptonia bacterium]|nr:hypothetical protein [Candidatus Kryptonia bacterium]